MFNPTWGVIYSIARSVGVAPPGGWLGIPSTALTAVALVAVWQFAGMPMILFLAAFLGIEDEVIDAAHIDGASGWQTFWQVRLPLILPTVGLVVILTFTAIFVAFDIVFVMEGPIGAPAMRRTCSEPCSSEFISAGLARCPILRWERRSQRRSSSSSSRSCSSI